MSSWGCGSQKVSTSDSGSSGPGLIAGQGHLVVFLGKALLLSVSLFTKEYKWVPVNCQGNHSDKNAVGYSAMD